MRRGERLFLCKKYRLFLSEKRPLIEHDCQEHGETASEKKEADVDETSTLDCFNGVLLALRKGVCAPLPPGISGRGEERASS